jgi:hypothetical protein
MAQVPACPRCDRSVEPEWRFCPHCEAILPEPPPRRRIAKFFYAILGGVGLSLFGVAMVVRAYTYPADMRPPFLGALAIVTLFACSVVAFAWKKRGKAGVGPFLVDLLALAGVAVLVCSVAAGSVVVLAWLLFRSLKG